MGNASLILGIVSIIMFFVSPLIALILAIVGIVLGIIGAIKKQKLSIAGIILSIISMLLFAAMFVITIFAVSDTIDNTRKDTFADISAEYIYNVRNVTLSDEIECTDQATEAGTFTKNSNLGNGEYYFFITTNSGVITSYFGRFDSSIANKAQSQTMELLDKPLKSAWENDEVYGWVHWTVDGIKKSFYVALTDESGRGIADETLDRELRRSSVLTSGARADMQKAIDAINNDTAYNGRQAVNNKVYYCHYVR